MSALKPILREVKQAGVKGLRHMDAKLHGVGDNISDHIDDVIRQVKGQDRFDNPNGNTPGGGGNGNTPHGNGNDGSNGGPRRDDQGRFAPNPDGPVDSRYDRPSGWRSGQRDTVWGDASNNSPDGQVRDPETNQVMNPDEPWVMGHEPGYEFRHHQRSAQERGLTREEFLEEYYGNLDHIRPELPSTSSGHRHELPWEDYQGQ